MRRLSFLLIVPTLLGCTFADHAGSDEIKPASPAASAPASAMTGASWRLDPANDLLGIGPRMRELARASDPLRAERERWTSAPPCHDLLALAPLTEAISLPAYYQEHDAWKEANVPFARLEDGLSRQAAAFIATGRDEPAHCASIRLHAGPGPTLS